MYVGQFEYPNPMLLRWEWHQHKQFDTRGSRHARHTHYIMSMTCTIIMATEHAMAAHRLPSNQ
jgi:hypothetical protein